MRRWLPLLLAAGVGGAPLPRDARDPLTPLLREIDEDLASIELMSEHAAEHARVDSLTSTADRAAARPEHPVQPRHSAPRLERERRVGWADIKKAWEGIKSIFSKDSTRARASIMSLVDDNGYWVAPDLPFAGWDAMYAKNKDTWDAAIRNPQAKGNARLATTELVIDEKRTKDVVLKLLASGGNLGYLTQEVRTACHSAVGTATPSAVARARMPLKSGPRRRRSCTSTCSQHQPRIKKTGRRSTQPARQCGARVRRRRVQPHGRRRWRSGAAPAPACAAHAARSRPRVAGPQEVLVIEEANQDAEATMAAVGNDDDARTSKAVDIIVGALKGAPPLIPRPSAPRIFGRRAPDRTAT